MMSIFSRSQILFFTIACTLFFQGNFLKAQDASPTPVLSPIPQGNTTQTIPTAPPLAQPAATNAPDTKTADDGTGKPQIVTPTPTPAQKKKGYKFMFAIMETSMGKIKIKLYQTKSPKTVDNFVGLAEGTKEWTPANETTTKKSHFYDGLTFHRIIPKFMIQGGDPQGDGHGGPGYDFPDEKYPDLNFDQAGMVAMANRGPNTNGSQFFITTDPVSFLNDRPGQHYTIFGEVVEGMDVVKKISQVPTDKTNDRPLKPVKIVKVTIQRK